MRTRLPWLLAGLACLLALALPLAAQNPALSKRLVLKDGSYQPVSKWEVHGDRVRYYSTERFEWEEVPNSLIDWAATDKWNKEREQEAVSPATREVSAEIEAERQAEEARSPTVASGVRLPENGGVFLLDQYRGQPQVVELVQSGGEVNKQMGRNILRAAINPIASSRQTIELKGAHARVQAHEPRPTLFVNIDSDKNPSTGEKPVDAAHRFRVALLQSKKDVRVVSTTKINMIGKVSEEQTFINAVSQPFSGEWIKVTPAVDLQPGEYALVELLNDKEINVYVWDFGVNPNAPANPGVWKPGQPVPAPTGTNETPVLKPKPK